MLSVDTALRGANHEVRVVALDSAPRALMATAAKLAREADVIFNLAESLGRASDGEATAAWAMALTGLPLTGALPRVLSLCVDKPSTRAILAAEGIPVPGARTVRRGNESLAALQFPVIVKPAAEDASHGIDEGSVVHEVSAGETRARIIAARFGAALVEEYIEGREIQVAMLGRPGEDPTLLPFGEIDFGPLAEGSPHILTYAAKWDENSANYQQTPAIGVRPMALRTERAIRVAATAVWHALGLGGYARVDFRVDATGAPFVIDVNPNPDLSPGGGFSLAARRAHLTHDELILRILDLAVPALARTA